MPCVWWTLCIESCTLLPALQSLVARLKENLEKLMEERDHCSTTENREKEQNKRLQRQIRDVKEEMGELAKKDAEASRKKHELVWTAACMLLKGCSRGMCSLLIHTQMWTFLLFIWFSFFY